ALRRNPHLGLGQLVERAHDHEARRVSCQSDHLFGQLDPGDRESLSILLHLCEGSDERLELFDDLSAWLTGQGANGGKNEVRPRLADLDERDVLELQLESYGTRRHGD